MISSGVPIPMQATPLAIVFQRSGESWDRHEVTAIESAIKLPSLNAELTLANVYRGVSLESV